MRQPAPRVPDPAAPTVQRRPLHLRVLCDGADDLAASVLVLRRQHHARGRRPAVPEDVAQSDAFAHGHEVGVGRRESAGRRQERPVADREGDELAKGGAARAEDAAFLFDVAQEAGGDGAPWFIPDRSVVLHVLG